MKLYLAVAVLMLALVAYTEAQDDTIEQHFNRFTDQMARMGQEIADKITTAFDKIQTSEAVVESKKRLTEGFEWLKNGVQQQLGQ